MECHFCKGTLEKKTAPFHVDRTGYHFTFDNIPAWICTQCGEAMFEEEQVNEIQRAIRDMDSLVEQLTQAA